MKKVFVIILSVSLVLSFLLIIGCKKTEKPAEAPMAPFPEVKGTDEHFQKADEFFLKKDMETAASEIQKASDLIKQEAEKATAEDKKALTASINELEKLAKDVEKGRTNIAMAGKSLRRFMRS